MKLIAGKVLELMKMCKDYSSSCLVGSEYVWMMYINVFKKSKYIYIGLKITFVNKCFKKIICGSYPFIYLYCTSSTNWRQTVTNDPNKFRWQRLTWYLILTLIVGPKCSLFILFQCSQVIGQRDYFNLKMLSFYPQHCWCFNIKTCLYTFTADLPLKPM